MLATLMILPHLRSRIPWPNARESRKGARRFTGPAGRPMRFPAAVAVSASTCASCPSSVASPTPVRPSSVSTRTKIQFVLAVTFTTTGRIAVMIGMEVGLYAAGGNVAGCQIDVSERDRSPYHIKYQTGGDMPYVDPSAALNGRTIRVSMEPLALDEPWSRVPLIANGSMRLVQLTMPSGDRTIPHFHPRAAEFFLVLAGSVEIYLDDDPPIAATPGDLVYASERVVHGINAGPRGVRFLAGVGPNEDAPDEEIQVRQPTNPA
jgi:quercetin dioxygenase-like cupin family protein